MTDIFENQFIAQAVGILASSFIVFAFNMKCDKRFKLVGAVGCLLFTIHFFMIGAYAGAIVSIANGIRSLTSVFFHRSTKVMSIFIFFYIVMGTIVFEEWIDLLPFISGVMGAYALFKLSGISMRMVGFIGSLMWLTYNIIFMSLGGIITECFVIASNAMTIFRIYLDRNRKPTVNLK